MPNGNHSGNEANDMKRLPLGWLAYFATYAGLILVAALAYADPAVLTFQAPTAYTDATPIAPGTALTYNVYQALQGQPLAKVATITATTTTITTGLTPGQTFCFAVTAVANGQESAQSNQQCKLSAFPVPNAVTITVK